MAKKVQPTPAGHQTVTASLTLRDTAQAIEFYKKAFGAEERMRMPMPGSTKVLHAEIRIGDSVLMLADEMPQMPCRSAQALGGSPVAFYVYVKDVDSAFQRAVSAGARADMPVQDVFYGDRIGKVTDPFGYSWTLATHVAEVPPAELPQRAKDFFARFAQRAKPK